MKRQSLLNILSALSQARKDQDQAVSKLESLDCRLSDLQRENLSLSTLLKQYEGNLII